MPFSILLDRNCAFISFPDIALINPENAPLTNGTFVVESSSEDLASNKLISNMGFVYEDTIIEALRDKATGKLHDQHIYRMLRKEYLAKKQR